MGLLPSYQGLAGGRVYECSSSARGKELDRRMQRCLYCVQKALWRATPASAYANSAPTCLGILFCAPGITYVGSDYHCHLLMDVSTQLCFLAH